MIRRQTVAQRNGGIEGCFVIGGFEFSAHAPSVRCLSACGQRVLSDRLLETAYYLTLSWFPPSQSTQHGLRWLVRGPGDPGIQSAAPQEVSLHTFLTQSDYYLDLLKGVLAVGRPLITSEALTYL